MKRVLICILLLFSLTGCRYLGYQEFDGGSNVINNQSDIKKMFEKLMDRNDHDLTTEVIANLVQLRLYSENGETQVVDISYNVFTSIEDNEVYTEYTYCTNLESNYICCSASEQKIFEEFREEISLQTVITTFSTYSLDFVIEELSKFYNIDQSKGISFEFGFKEFDNKSINISELENTILYKDGESVNIGEEEVSSLLLYINVRVYIGEEKERVHMYIDME